MPLGVSTLGALVLGLDAGLPFAVIFAAAQRLRPDAPGAAIGLVNGSPFSTILVGTPLAGLAFDLPGDGRLAFAGDRRARGGGAHASSHRTLIERDNRPPEREKENQWP